MNNPPIHADPMGLPKFNDATPVVGKSELDTILRERRVILKKIQQLRARATALKDLLDTEFARERELRERRRAFRNDLIFVKKLCGAGDKSLAKEFGIGGQAVLYAWHSAATRYRHEAKGCWNCWSLKAWRKKRHKRAVTLANLKGIVEAFKWDNRNDWEAALDLTADPSRPKIQTIKLGER